MHEASIADSIIHTVLDKAREQNAVRVITVEIELGEWMFLNPEQLSFWINAGFHRTMAEGAKIRFRQIPGKARCASCGYEGPLQEANDPAYHMKMPMLACPVCREGGLEIRQGRDVCIRSIKIKR